MNCPIESIVRVSDRLLGLSTEPRESEAPVFEIYARSPEEAMALRRSYADSLRDAWRETRAPEGRESLEEVLRLLEEEVA